MDFFELCRSAEADRHIAEDRELGQAAGRKDIAGDREPEQVVAHKDIAVEQVLDPVEADNTC